MTDSSGYYVRPASTDKQKYEEVRRIFGEQAESVLQRCGTIAYDYLNLNMRKNYCNATFVNNDELFSKLKHSVLIGRPQDLVPYMHDANSRQAYWNWNLRCTEVNSAQNNYKKFREQELAAERARAAQQQAATPTVDPKLKAFLERTVGNADLAGALTTKYGDKAYTVALSAVMEPGAMVTDLGIKVDGKFSSRNLLTTLTKEETNLDDAKLNTFLDGYSARKAQRDSATAAKDDAADEEPAPMRVKKLDMPEIKPATIDVKIAEIPQDIKLEGTTKYLPFVQDGKTYNLYNLPNGFVVKGDLDLSNRGLTELPDLSKVKVKGSLNLSGNELTSIEGLLPEVGKDINLNNNKLTSLNGMPDKVNGYFSCSGNKLTTLEGGPKKVNGGFDCRDNQLTTLEGGPEKVGESYICAGNMLSNLKGAPSEIKATFACYGNKLTSLEGAPKYVAGDFMAHNNALVDLTHAPKEVGKDFYVGNNPLTSVDGVKRVGNLLHDELLAPDVAAAQQALLLMPMFRDRQDLAHDMLNAVKLTAAGSRVATDAPTAADARFDQAFARRSAETEADHQQSQTSSISLSMEDLMAQVHGYRGK